MHTSNVSRRRFLSLSGLAAAGGLLARNPFARACPELEDLGPARGLANGMNRFAVDLHARLAKTETGNLFVSPFSISAALAMTSAGATGDTLKEMQQVLRLPEEPHVAFRDLLEYVNGPKYELFRKDSAPSGLVPKESQLPPFKRKYELSSANALWGMKGYPWRKAFLELTKAHYGAGLVETNFADGEASRKLINGWVEKETKEKIKDLIPRGVLNLDTRLVLTNAIYFKGDWHVKFDTKNTKDAPFTLADGSKATVPLMNLTSEFNYGVLNLDDLDIEEPKVLPSLPPQILPRCARQTKVEVLEMPYAGKNLSMLVYLPETPAAINRVVDLLSGADLSQPALKPRQVKVSLPRFKAESNLSLKPVLVDMGMKRAFGPAEFSPMHTSREHLFISHVLHKSFVDVNEEGSEAAAATAVVIIKESHTIDEPVAFRADRPFVFAIRENKTGAVLFLGRYMGPKA